MKRESFEELKRRILAKRPYCEACPPEAHRRATELHHCIVKRDSHRPDFDVEENLEPVCSICHTSLQSGVVNSYEHRRAFVERQIVQWGFDIKKWYQGLELKEPEFWIWHFEVVD